MRYDGEGKVMVAKLGALNDDGEGSREREGRAIDGVLESESLRIRDMVMTKKINNK